MVITRHRSIRGAAAILVGVLATAGLIGVPGVAVEPAGAAVVDDQPLSAVASSMWQTNNTVWAIDVANNVVYAGGQFTAVRPPGVALNGAGTVTRNRIAAFNATTGALITTFNPNANGMVYDLDVSNDGTKLYVVGSFTTIGGVTRQRIARLNLPSGTVDAAWSANANAIVATVSSDNSNVFVGGDFTRIKNVARTRIAKLNATNGNVVTAFNASSDKRISESALGPNSNRLILGGENDVINGVNQGAVASLNTTTGALMPWAATGIAPRPAQGGCESNITDIITSGNTAYVTAEAPPPGCWEGYYAANITDGALVYNMHCLGGSIGLAVANGWMYRASHNHDCSKNPGGYVGPNNANNFIWYRLQAHRLSDGRLGHWSPTTNGGSPGTSTTVGPQVIATDGTNIYTGGDFSTVNGSAQQGITRFTASGGNAAPETPATPRAVATAAGSVEVSVEGVRDNNDGMITYTMFRDGGTTPIQSVVAESWPWSRPTVRFEDSGMTAGTAHSYQVTASDGTATSGRSPSSLPVVVGHANPPGYAAAIAEAGAATAHWRLDGGGSLLADASGSGNTGTIVGGVETGQPGAVLDNTAITTNGVDGYVTSSAPITQTGAFTQSVWFNTTTDRGGTIMGFSNAQTGPGDRDNRAIYMENDGKIIFGIRRGNVNNPSTSFIRSAGTFNDGRWHQATAVFNGTNNISLYLDGTLNGTLNITQPFTPPPSYLRLGFMDVSRYYNVFGSNYDGKPHILSYFFAGSIDEAALHPAALTADEVGRLYASGAAHGAALPQEQPDPGPPPPPPPPSSYPQLVLADAPSMYWRLNEAGQLPVADSSGNNRAGTYRNGLSFGQPGALTDGSTGVVSPGTSGVAYTNQQVTNPQTFSLETWVKTASFNGGKIIGLENAQTGWGTTHDRVLSMTNNGRVAYGIRAGGLQPTVTSTASYNDNEWHHVVATQGASGMALYVDGQPVGTDPTASPDAANGYWRLGGGNVTGWPDAPASSALNGSFDEVAVYPAALTAERVAAHFGADPPPAPTPPAAPGLLRSTSVTATSVALAWNSPSGTITGYTVFRDGVPVGAPTGPAFTDTGLAPATAYAYTVTATNSDDLESVPTAPLGVVTASGETNDVVFPTGSVWRYTDDGVNLGTAWRAPGFDDTAWESGPAQLGYGDGDEATTMFNGGTTPASRWLSHYLRRTFSVTDVTQITGLSLSVLRDDAVAVYVNGVEAFRDNLPAGTITNTTFGVDAVFGAAENTFTDFAIPPSMLVEGTNVVAVSLHQESRQGAADVSFDAALTAVRPAGPAPPPPPPDEEAPSVPQDLTAPTVSASQVVLTWSPSSDNVAVTGYDVLRDGSVVGSPNGPTFTDVNVGPAETHSYTVRAKDAAGNQSPEGSALVVTTPDPQNDAGAPSVPADLRVVSRSATRVQLAWDASTDDTGVTGYVVARNGVDLPTSTQPALEDTLLAPGAAYTYTVRALDGAGNVSAPSEGIAIVTHLSSETAFARNSEWRFTDDGLDRGTAWKEPDFADAAWKTGAGQLGYGDGDETTVMFNGGTVANQRWLSHYLRKSFTIADAAQTTGLTLSVLRDDGVVVYVNGVEAFRDNVPSGPVTNTTFASSGLFGAAESTYTDFEIPAAMLREGTNVIAVSLHQDSRSGAGDLSFDAGLTVRYG